MFVYIILIVIILVYLNGIKTYDYWKKRGVKHNKVLPYIGTSLKQFRQKASITMMTTEMYRKYPEEKVVGHYEGTRPVLIIRDPDIVKRILVTDFQHFHSRRINLHKNGTEVLLKNIFHADGDFWRLLRNKFTPVFSKAKVKAMFPIIRERTEKLQTTAENIAKLDFYDMQDLMARYTTEFIGACGFGIDMDCISDGASQFRTLGKRILYRSLKDTLSMAMSTIFPSLGKNMRIYSTTIEQMIIQLVDQVLKERNYQPSGRNDFIDLMLEMKQREGGLSGKSMKNKNPDGSPEEIYLELDDSIIIAQVFVFFAAGFETSSSTSSYTLHQLAFNPFWQKIVQKEIDCVLAKYNGEITFDAIEQMQYLKFSFYEAMRMNPSLGHLVRTCTSQEYTIPEIDLTINEGVKVLIPIQALQNNEKYYKDPDRFDPERFDQEKNEIPSFTYMPFGEGPRMCIAYRLGTVLAMAGVAAILQKFTVEPAACSVRNPQPDPKAFTSEGFIGGLPLKLRKRFD